LGAVSKETPEVGFAALTESDAWIGLGLDWKSGSPGSFALILPSALNRPGIDREDPIKILAVGCYAEEVPAPRPTVGEVVLDGLRPPVLIGQRVLLDGVAATARRVACSYVGDNWIA
jgi:hypothetical protein